MKKTVLILMLGVLFIASNLFAADGDLIVEGNVGIGTSAPSTTLDIVGNGKITATGTGLSVYASTVDSPQRGVTSVNATAYWLGGDNFNRGATGGRYVIFIKGSDTQGDATIVNQDLTAQGSEIYYGRTDKTDTYTIDSAAALSANHQRYGDNTRAMNLDNMYGLLSTAQQGTGSGGKIFTTNFYHAYFGSFQYSNVWQADNIYGLYIQGNYGLGTSNTGIWVGRSIQATNNYGIVLDGDGKGADLVLGSNKETKLYGDAGNLIIDTSGKVGIGTTTAPAQKLEVAGAIKIANSSSSTCNPANAGTIRFVSPDFWGCNGSIWVKLNN